LSWRFKWVDLRQFRNLLMASTFEAFDYKIAFKSFTCLQTHLPAVIISGRIFK
jgi:hypothetical protein